MHIQPRKIASVIAIDGPAASGKSTLGKNLADCLGYLYFDTGVMYRAVTWQALEKGLMISDEAGITCLAQEIDIDVRTPSANDGRGYDVVVEGKDVTWAIRRAEVDSNVSQVSAYQGVRKALTEAQRKIGLRGQVVMVGRDIGTVVLPEADLKIFLNASAEERARRRYQELVERGHTASLDEILDAMVKRDRIDSTRDVAPLRVAEDAVVIESDGLSADEVLAKARQLVGDCQ
jgi:cytidylate kinase